VPPQRVDRQVFGSRWRHGVIGAPKSHGSLNMQRSRPAVFAGSGPGAEVHYVPADHAQVAEALDERGPVQRPAEPRPATGIFGDPLAAAHVKVVEGPD